MTPGQKANGDNLENVLHTKTKISLCAKFDQSQLSAYRNFASSKWF